jgi:subtilase-type serine protease
MSEHRRIGIVRALGDRKASQLRSTHQKKVIHPNVAVVIAGLQKRSSTHTWFDFGMPAPFVFAPIALASAALVLAGCSGGTSSGSAAATAPLPIAAPAPEPTPPKGNWASEGVPFDPVRAQQILTSAEFRGADANCVYVGCASSGAPALNQSQAFELHNLHTALSSGVTGANQLVAVVDSGFLTTHQEFTGKTVHQYGALPSADHGTHVASLIAGVQDGKGMHGVAPGASLHLTATNPTGGTSFDLANVTAGTLNATSLGAVAQNNSWGFSVSAADFEAHLQANPGRTVAQGLNAVIGNYGSAKWQAYLDALDGFQKQGVVVWSLSNDETMSSGDVMGALPYFDQRLQGAWVAAANGYFEVDGAGDITKAIRLSAPCGFAASFCIAGDGTTTAANANSNTGYSAGTGSSYVAPQIAGTVALLAEAFPDLNPEDWTKRLLASADNSWFSRLGVAVSGTSDFGNGVTHAYSGEWGHGVLDISAALSPIGAVSYLSGDHVLTSSRTDLIESTLLTPESFGNGLETALSGEEVAVFDALNRSYAIEGSHLVAAQTSSPLPDLMRSFVEPAWGVLPSHRSVLASRGAPVGGSLSISSDANGLFETKPITVRHDQSSIFSLVHENVSLTSSHRTGPLEITAVGFAGQGAAGHTNTVAGGGLNLALGDESRMSIGMSYLGEQDSLLGLERSPVLGWGDGSSVGTIHVGLDHQLTAGLTLFGRYEYGAAGSTGHTAGMVTSMSNVHFSGFQIGARMDSVLSAQDSLGFSVAQPLRIERGTMDLNVPTGRTVDGQIQQRQLSADLEPNGRELDLGIDYQVPVGTGQLQLGLQYRLDAGHARGNSAMGIAMNFGQWF